MAVTASSQHGLITFDQARQAGLTRHQIQHRLQTGRWVRVHRGVFRVGGAPITWEQAAATGCLASPPGAGASHLTAAALTDLGEAPLVPPHVTVAPSRSSRLVGVVTHRSPLPATDLTVIEACRAPPSPARWWTAQGSSGRYASSDWSTRRSTGGWSAWTSCRPCGLGVRAAPGRSGETKLRNAIEPWVGPITPGSPGEARLRQRLVQWGLPEPELQVVVRSADGTLVARIDLGWSPYLVGIEYDSSRWHGPSRWSADLRRQQALEELGWVVLRADRSDLEPGAAPSSDRSARPSIAKPPASGSRGSCS